MLNGLHRSITVYLFSNNDQQDCSNSWWVYCELFPSLRQSTDYVHTYYVHITLLVILVQCEAREEVLLEAYVGVVEMEALCMIDMMNQAVIPSMKNAGFPTSELEAGVATLKSGLKELHESESTSQTADLARVLRLETMEEVRKICDEAEAVCPADLWTIATYKELLFNDVHMGNSLYTA